MGGQQPLASRSRGTGSRVFVGFRVWGLSFRETDGKEGVGTR